MLLTYKVDRRRNNNVIPITLTRALPYNATQKTVVSRPTPMRSLLDSTQTSRITDNIFDAQRMDAFRDKIRQLSQNRGAANQSKTAAQTVRPMIDSSPRVATTVTQRTDLPSKKMLKARPVPVIRGPDMTASSHMLPSAVSFNVALTVATMADDGQAANNFVQ